METKEAARQFLISKIAKGLTGRTIESYSYRLNIFADAWPVLPTTVEAVESFLAERGPTIQTRETYYRLLRNFYRWLVARRAIAAAENPITGIEAPRLPRQVARALSPDELRQLLNHPRHTDAVRAFLLILVDTGVRLSEALSVTPGSHRWVDSGHVLVVSGKTGEREVPITEEVWEVVRRALPWPWASRDAAGTAVRKAFTQAGLTGRRASAQTIRHTFVRLWSGDESVLVGIMGWTTPRMLSRYRPFDLGRALDQHQRYSPLKAAELALEVEREQRLS